MGAELQGRKSNFLKYHLPLYIYVLMIFGLSSIPQSDLPNVNVNFPIDKIVHFFEYAIFGALMARVIYNRFGMYESVIIVIFVAALLGAMDESYQSLTHRSTDIYDWITDCFGAMAGSTAFVSYMKLVHSRSSQKVS